MARASSYELTPPPARSVEEQRRIDGMCRPLWALKARARDLAEALEQGRRLGHDTMAEVRAMTELAKQMGLSE